MCGRVRDACDGDWERVRCVRVVTRKREEHGRREGGTPFNTRDGEVPGGVDGNHCGRNSVDPSSRRKERTEHEGTVKHVEKEYGHWCHVELVQEWLRREEGLSEESRTVVRP